MNNEGCIFFHIYVPVYKVEPYIRECVNSVLSQTYKNFKLVLVDDGSPDSCGQICDEYASRDDRVFVIHQENKGLMAARQAALKWGLSADEGRKDCFVVHLDSDDSLKSNALETIARSIKETNSDLIVYGMDDVFNGKTIKKFDPSFSFIGTVTDTNELLKIVLSSSCYNSLCRKAACISLYEGIDYSPYYKIKQGEDLLQSMELYCNCRRALFIEDSLYNYTMNPSSITHVISEESFSNSILFGYVVSFLEKHIGQCCDVLGVFYKSCLIDLNNSLKDILNFVPSRKKKISLLSTMRNEEFNDFLLDLKESDEFFFLRLLRNCMYSHILFYGRLYSILFKVYHSIMELCVAHGG